MFYGLMLCFLLFVVVRCELVAVQVVSRHGTRAPDKILNTICVNERPNLQRYAEMSITLSGMTGRGQQELYDLGIFTAQRYKSTGFLKEKYIQSDIFIRAVGSERTLQSAFIWANALYPAETRSVNYLANVPAAVPIYSVDDHSDSLIEIRKGQCARRLGLDIATWDTTKGPKLWNTGVAEGLNEMCGNDIQAAVGNNPTYTLGDAIKDITDAIIFDDIEQFPALPNWTLERFVNYSKFAADQLIDRLYGTDAQVTYMNGDLPRTLLGNFRKSMAGMAKYKMWAYHGHREMSYALMKLLGVNYAFLTRRGIPITAIPAATTLFLELHNSSLGEWYVQTWVWAPCIKDHMTGEEFHSLSAKHSYRCPATLVTLKGCIENCPYHDFRNIILNHIKKTGNWSQLCSDTPSPMNLSAIPPTNLLDVKLVCVLFALVLGLGLLICYIFSTKKSFQYMPIPDNEA